HPGVTLHLSNSEIRGPVSGGTERIIFVSADATINSHHNDFEGRWMYYWGATPTVTLTSDYNTFAGAQASWYIDGVVYNNLADYQAATGQDANSTVGT